MNDSTLILIIVLAAILLVAFVLLFFFMNRNNYKQQLFIKEALNQSEKQKNDDIDNFKNQISTDLLQFQNTIRSNMQNDMERSSRSTEERLGRMETKLNEGILNSFEKTNKAFSSVMEQMARIDETQKNLKELSTDITSLQSILSDKKTRGTFGEVELYSILESVFGPNNKRYERQFKLSNGNIADAVLHAPDPLGDIIIDSKFPLENYNRLQEDGLTGAELTRVQNEFRKDVLKHIKDIHDKYLIPGETAEVAYMFIPAEAVFAEIYGHYDDIIQVSYQSHVFIVSPTTLMAYVTALKAIYLGQERNEKVAEIQEEYTKLAVEFGRFEDRYLSVMKDFEKTYKDMQSVSITSEKLVRQFKKIESVDLSEDEKSSDDQPKPIE